MRFLTLKRNSQYLILQIVSDKLEIIVLFCTLKKTQQHLFE